MSWFKRKQTAKPVVPVKDTKDVIVEIESGADKVDVPKNRLKLTDDFFVGTAIDEANRKERQAQVQEIPFNSWLSASKVESPAAFDDIFLKAFNQTHANASVHDIQDGSLSNSFVDLTTKFRFAKLLQAASGFSVPDYQLTRFQTPIAFRAYFLKEVISGKLASFKESEPNAIDLNNDSYDASSIRVIKDVKVKQQKKTLSKILTEVEALERAATKEALERARQAA